MKSGKIIFRSLLFILLLLSAGVIVFAGDANFAGVWQTNYGVITFEQTGNKVKGSYTHDNGLMDGTVTGNRLDLRWSESPAYAPPNDAGDAYFIMSDDGKSFSGKWRYGYSGEWEYNWTGTLSSRSNDPGPGATPAPSETHPSGTKGGPMLFVPAGEFTMGRGGEGVDAHFDEGPPVTIYVDEFYIDKYQVTNEEFDKCAVSGPCGTSDAFYYKDFDGPKQPAVGVSWYQAEDYCKWVGTRLPTDAEWEKAARGTDGRAYPWGEGVDCSRANYKLCGAKTTKPVGSYPAGASPYGALDMSGNVQEWTSDWYDRWYHKNYASSRNPRVPKSPEWVHMNKTRCTRGGSWRVQYVSVLRTSYRNNWIPIARMDFVGFRCVK